MASFENHIDQAKKNLAFLIETNERNATNWDWQVTIAFYVSVHVVNAHLANVADWHFRAHEDVKNALYDNNSPAKVPDNIYLAYTKLENLSRRARYLCSENKNDHSVIGFFTYDKHFAKAIKYLDTLLAYFKKTYGMDLGTPIIKCQDLNSNSPLTIFKVNQ